MKQLLLSLLIMITFSTVNAQNAVIGSDGNYYSVKFAKGENYTKTGKSFFDAKGGVHPMYVTKEGKVFIFKENKRVRDTDRILNL
jgi:hypothetical protein